jgi:SCF-associated factor 1
VWWPFGGTFWDRAHKAMAEQNRNKPTEVVVPDGETVIPCHTWEINMDPVKLAILPDLPELPATGLSEEERRKETKLIKIEAIGHCLVGLTNKGHVLKMDRLYGWDSTQDWNYVSESYTDGLAPLLEP